MFTTQLTLIQARDQLRGFTNQESVILSNTSLTDNGQKLELDKLATQKWEYRPQAVRAVVSAHDALLARFNANQSERLSVQEAAAKAWDYERLNYQARAIQAGIKQINTVDDLRKAFDQARQSGDKHQLRAFCENGPEVISKRFLGADLEGGALLMHDMKLALSELLTTPALDTIDKIGAALADEAINLKEVAKECNRFYGGVNEGVFGLETKSEFSAVMNSITVTRDYDGQGGFFVHVTVDPI
jgi:hypothetical protein